VIPFSVIVEYGHATNGESAHRWPPVLPPPVTPSVSKETPMTGYIQTVVTVPVVGREDEFNRWYDDTHLREMLQVPGFVAGRRYALTGPRSVDGPRFLAVYEIETDDLAATLQALSAAAATMTVSDAMDQPATVTDLYEVLGDRRTATRAPTAPAPTESNHGDHPYPGGSDRGAADPTSQPPVNEGH
jgi:hypothetical protein